MYNIISKQTLYFKIKMNIICYIYVEIAESLIKNILSKKLSELRLNFV